MKVNTTLAVSSLGNHNLEGGKTHQEFCTVSFPQSRPKLCSFSRGVQPPSAHTSHSPTPASLPGLLLSSLPAPLLHFKCFAAIRDVIPVIPATCPTGQPVPPSSPKAHRVNKCATAGWSLSQAATACTPSMGWKDETDQIKTLNIFHHDHQVVDRILNLL